MDMLERLKIIAETTSEGWPTTSIDWEYREAVKEIERLREIVDDLGLTPEAARAGLERSRANKRDAERYRWLRTSDFSVFGSPHAVELEGALLDAAIDEAMGKPHN